jgi:carbonic anhydrase
MGSLTTPPCSEEVLWMILKQPVTLSHEQMRLFAQQYPNNARPVQPTNGRVVRDAQ